MKKIISVLTLGLFVSLININVNNKQPQYFLEDDTYTLKDENTIKLNRKMVKNDSISFDNAINDGKMISSVKAQILDNGNNTYNIRFVSAIVWDETNSYSRIGFDVNYYYNNQWFSYSRDISTLYTTLTAGDKQYNEANMSLYDNTSNYKYFVTYALINIPSSALDTCFEVRPFAYSFDETKLYSSKESKFTSVNSVKKNCSTYKVISSFASNDSQIKYIEPVHDRNKKNEVVGTDSSEIDTRAAKNSTSLDKTKYIENVSAYSKFQYTYESNEAKGKLDIYANVASSNYISGDVSTIWPEAKNGFIGSKATDFTKFLTLKNNDTEYEVSSDAKIPETRLNSFMDPATIKQQEAIKKSAWGTCTYFLLNNFRRVHLGTVDIVKGTNNIEIDVGYNSGPFGYAGSACGNWQNIEIIYVDNNVDNNVTSMEMKTAPTKTSYEANEEFDITGAEFIGYNADGISLGKIENSKIEILNNKKLFVNSLIDLKYQNATYEIYVNVNNVVKQALNTLENMTIQYHENPNVTNKKANIVGPNSVNGYLEKVSDGSYFEYIVEADKEINATISAEIATNAYVYKTGEYKDYDTGIEGFTQTWIGSHDLDMSKIVTLTNTVNNETTTFETNKDAIAYGHIINAKDDLEASKKYDLTKTNQQWGMADDLCMRKFKELNLGEIKLSKGTNVIRISIKGYLKENGFAYNGYACGNWKSISIAFK